MSGPPRAEVDGSPVELIWARARAIFDLTSDQAAPADIDAAIRAGVEFRGTNLWLLVFATLIASIGLNVNSAAVIIGAMLVSPLMGPIMAVGYGAAVNDFALIRAAARNLAMAVVFSMLASTAYFLVTPLSEARSEILARTSPTIWDVLVAVFGGLAGIVGVTRREKSNVIPGVAIATALMPPLCTSGYGLATLQPFYALGALYLFSINSVFIATATFAMVRVMRLPEVTPIDERSRRRARRAIGAIVLLTGVPSVWLAVGLVRQQVFTARAEEFLASAFPPGQGTFLVGTELDPVGRVIQATVLGDPVNDERRLELDRALTAFGLPGARFEIQQARRESVDVESLRAQVAGDLQRDTMVALDEKTKEIAALNQRIADADARRSALEDLVTELQASYPRATDVAVGLGAEWDGAERHEALLVGLTLPEPLPDEERARLERWLEVRGKSARVRISVSVPPPAGPGGHRAR